MSNMFLKLLQKYNKQITAAVLSGAMIFGGVTGLTSCKPNDSGMVDPDGNKNNNNNNKNNNEFKYCSSITQKILTDEYYTSLAKADHGYSGKYLMLPFAFLAEQGEDIDKIMNEMSWEDGRHAEMTYLVGNDLYIACKIQHEASTNYYANYLIKYTLTDREVTEAKILFNPIENNEGTYCQSAFFIQELSVQKKGELVSLAYSTKETDDKVLEALNKKYKRQDLTLFYTGRYVGEVTVWNGVIEDYVTGDVCLYNYFALPKYRSSQYNDNVYSIQLRRKAEEINSGVMLDGNLVMTEFNDFKNAWYDEKESPVLVLKQGYKASEINILDGYEDLDKLKSSILIDNQK